MGDGVGEAVGAGLIGVVGGLGGAGRGSHDLEGAVAEGVVEPGVVAVGPSAYFK